ncbi:Abi family protein [Candidatus Nitrosacidococcus tergens]|uniref:Abortive infection bacteriophage resistance protein n=1 Tax=Candidatus Nitrosacidococcus tergens TaxID=553981 RepID=A0A7G1QAX9_9GAMM|nr:Abi family protein [Candidatus Nitrosacidococcus tergens]CAB1276312.1 Abortive infection bacteriophage resistance protein [Candidatus Nitrosacidococcus tergens]
MAISLIPFNKPAYSPEQLLQKLEKQGLVVDDTKQACNYIRFMGGYRLKGYWHHLVDLVTKAFPAGYRFECIVSRCEFDRKLRVLTMAAIERLEIAVRVVMANYLSLRYSPHWFLDAHLFKQGGATDLVAKIEAEVERARAYGKTFVEYYFSRYSKPHLPPSWSVCECVTFGLWSKTYQLLKNSDDRKAISRRFNINTTEVFESWIHTLTVVRNMVAHSGQLLRVTLGVPPKNYHKENIWFTNSKSFYAVATVINYLLHQTGLPQAWPEQLSALFAEYPEVDLAEIGFPKDWSNQSGWR